MVLSSLEEEANKIKEVLDKGDVDLVFYMINKPSPPDQVAGRYYGTGLNSFNVSDFESKRAAGESVKYYSVRIKLLSQNVPDFVELSDGIQIYRIKRTEKRRLGIFKKTMYEIEQTEGGFVR